MCAEFWISEGPAGRRVLCGWGLGRGGVYFWWRVVGTSLVHPLGQFPFRFVLAASDECPYLLVIADDWAKARIFVVQTGYCVAGDQVAVVAV